ncbi:autotransporter domain-containing protein [Phaeovibrio sulfidiphilus]|uniref:Autotransporter domain-containing protein n=1 Tax=Phaeovibrio sulfidiphilus TaxID=1220600 RepID=A0A8J6YL56_9PROT|nr:autotransporter domain-containing protein [Phaeovibrio sulfidiphilus]MBE1236350.1 autotransporter domain-containing protein [Phaeovibrio sulfidiphilus]
MTASHTTRFTPPAQAGARRRGLALTGVALALALTATGAAPAQAAGTGNCAGGRCEIGGGSSATWAYLLKQAKFSPKVLSGLTFGNDATLVFDKDTVLEASAGKADQKVSVGSGQAATITVSQGKSLTISGNAETVSFGGAVSNSGTMTLGEADGGSLNFALNTFTDNSAGSAYGGAVYNTGTLNLKAISTFDNNTVTAAGDTARGGAIANVGSGSATVVADKLLTFSGNVASGTSAGGGAIYNSGTVTLKEGGTFTENKAEAAAGVSNATGVGGAIANDGGVVDVQDDSTFLKNTATTSGGAIYTSGAGAAVSFSAPVMFTENSAGSGGAIYNEGGTVTFSGSVGFLSNAATDGSGGVLYNGGGIVTFSHGGGFTSNTATADGGAIYTKGGTVTISGNAYFGENTAAGNGGAIYNLDGTVELSTEEGQKINFSGNKAGSAGSQSSNGIYLEAVNAPAALKVGGAGTVSMLDPMAGTAGENQEITITKSGAGLWQLKGESTFKSGGADGAAGKTTFAVTEGTLAFNGADTKLTLDGAGSSFTLNSGATLAVHESGAAITVGDGSTTGTITLKGGATLAFDLTKHDAALTTPMLTFAANDTVIEASKKITINLTDFKKVATGSQTYTLVKGLTLDSGNANDLQYRGETIKANTRMGALLTFAGTDRTQVTVSALENERLLANDYYNVRNWGVSGDIWSLGGDGAETFLPGDAVEVEMTANKSINVTEGGVEVAAMTVSGTGEVTFTGGLIQSTDRTSLDPSVATGKLTVKDGASAVFEGDLQFANGYDVQGMMTFKGESLKGNVANEGSFTFASAGDVAYSGVLSGGGTFEKTGDGALYLSGDHAATGQFTLTKGTLGGKFSYAGTLALAEGAILAPGDATSVGTMTVNALDTTAGKFTLQVRVAPDAAPTVVGQGFGNGAPSTNDSLNVLTGDVTIPAGSTLAVGTLVGSSNWSTTKTYVVLTAAGTGAKVVKTFDIVERNADLPFLSVTQVQLDAGGAVTTNADDVKSIGLLATFNAPTPDPVPPTPGPSPDPAPKPTPSPWDDASPNQRAVGQAVASMSPGPVQDAVINASRSEGLQILSMLSGDAYANVAGALRQGAPQLSRTVLNTLSHLAPSRDGIVGGGRVQVASTEQVSLTPSDGQLRNHNVWAQVSGSHDSWDSDGNAAKSTSSGIGVTAGASFGFEDGWFTGAVFRYAHRDFKVSDRAAKADIDSFSGGVYGGKVWDAGVGTLRTTLAGLYTRHEVDSKRSVIGERLSADYGADVFQVFGEAAWRVQANDWLMVEPFVGAAWNMAHSEDFSETGGAAALRSHSWTTHTGTSTLGVRMDARVHECAVLKLDLGWEHTWGDINPASRLAFVSGSTDFSVRGTPADRDVAVVGVGGEVAIDDAWALNLMYDGAYGSDTTSHGGRARLTYRW